MLIQAYQTIQNMHQRYSKLHIQHYLATSIIEQIFKQVGVPMSSMKITQVDNPKEQGSFEDNSELEEMDEEIQEESGNEDYM